MLTPEADKIIKNHVLIALGISVVPIPGIDFFMVSYVQMDMLGKLAEAYGKPYYFGDSGYYSRYRYRYWRFPYTSDYRNRKAYLSVISTMTLARLGSSFIKAIPVVGTMIGGASSIIMNGASTYALGKVTAKFIQEGKELADIDMEFAKSLFEEELEAGKVFATKLFKNNKAEMKAKRDAFAEEHQQAEEEKAIYQKLIKLQKMRDEGLITEEEYEMKRIELEDGIAL